MNSLTEIFSTIEWDYKYQNVRYDYAPLKQPIGFPERTSWLLCDNAQFTSSSVNREQYKMCPYILRTIHGALKLSPIGKVQEISNFVK